MFAEKSNLFENDLRTLMKNLLSELKGDDDNQNIKEFFVYMEPGHNDIYFYVANDEEEQIEVAEITLSEDYEDLSFLSPEEIDELDDDDFDEYIDNQGAEYNENFYKITMKVFCENIIADNFSVLNKSKDFSFRIESHEDNEEDYEKYLVEFLPSNLLEENFTDIYHKFKLFKELEDLSIEEQCNFWIKAYETILLRIKGDFYNRLDISGLSRHELLERNIANLQPFIHTHLINLIDKHKDKVEVNKSLLSYDLKYNYLLFNPCIILRDNKIEDTESLLELLNYFINRYIQEHNGEYIPDIVSKISMSLHKSNPKVYPYTGNFRYLSEMLNTKEYKLKRS